nr:APC family permease [Rhodococcus sp. (in: high G+C Gram-positive bacteria)]
MTVRNESAPPPDATTSAAGHGAVVKRINVRQLVMIVLGYMSPLGAAAGYIALVIAYGNGIGAPVTFLAAGVLFGLFAVGFGAIVKHVDRPGAFYAYATAGLGKRAGLAIAFLAALVYFLSSAGTLPLAGIVASDVVSGLFHGPSLPWWTYAIAMMAIAGAVCYRGVQLNARVLGVIVIAEIAIILLFNVVTFARGGEAGRSVESFSFDAFTGGSVAIGFMFAFTLFCGFETTAIYRDEVVDPARTIRRATMIIVAVISIFYALTSWAIITALGANNAVGVAAAAPADAFPSAVSSMLGAAFGDIVRVLIVTSLLASEIAILNAAARYVHNLSADGVLPTKIASAHPRYGSPSRAVLVAAVASTLLVAAYALTGAEPSKIYATAAGAGIYAYEFTVFVVSIAIIVYFRRNRGSGENVWRTLVAPGLSAIAFGALLILSIQKFDLLVGERLPITNATLALILATPVIGFLYACYLAAKRRDVFERIGRSEA